MPNLAEVLKSLPTNTYFMLLVLIVFSISFSFLIYFIIKRPKKTTKLYKATKWIISLPFLMGPIIFLIILSVSLISAFKTYQLQKEARILETDQPKMGIQEVEKSEAETQEEITGGETANWKTYRNEGYRFEMKYPPDVEPFKCLNVGCNRLEMSLPEGTKISFLRVSQSEAVGSRSLANWAAKHATGEGILRGSFATIEIDKIESFIVTTDDPIESWFLFPPIHQKVVFIYKNKSEQYVISHHDKTLSDEFKEDATIFNQMLSTFRFLE